MPREPKLYLEMDIVLKFSRLFSLIYPLPAVLILFLSYNASSAKNGSVSAHL